MPSVKTARSEYAAGPEETGNLLLVRYPDEARARAAHESFLKAYLPEADPGAAAPAENGKWTLARTHKNYLAAVFEAPSKEYAEGLYSAIRFPEK